MINLKESEINLLIDYSEIIGNWLTIKILEKISKCKYPIIIEELQKELTTKLSLYYYREKLNLLEYHKLIDHKNMITLKGKRFLKHLEKLTVIE